MYVPVGSVDIGGGAGVVAAALGFRGSAKSEEVEFADWLCRLQPVTKRIAAAAATPNFGNM
jgi:hypothetical protein